MWSYQDSALSWSGARQKVTEKKLSSVTSRADAFFIR